VDAFDDFVVASLVGREVGDPHSRVAGRSADELVAALAPRRGPERMLDFLLRVGPYGDAFGADPDGLTLAVLEASPHGVDLGPLEPRLPDVLRTESGRIELAPALLTADVARLDATLDGDADDDGGLVLIGRRQLRSNNSWMHNLPALVKGRERCTLLVNPLDAARLGLVDGEQASVRSAVGALEAPVELTDEIMPGVVSIPHGWGHDAPGVRMDVARAHAGVNSNVLADESLVEPLTGNAVLNGIPVEVAPA
jgi:anaerobic selenocysteine-containing dehydrogenase